MRLKRMVVSGTSTGGSLRSRETADRRRWGKGISGREEEQACRRAAGVATRRGCDQGGPGRAR